MATGKIISDASLSRVENGGVPEQLVALGGLRADGRRANLKPLGSRDACPIGGHIRIRRYSATENSRILLPTCNWNRRKLTQAKRFGGRVPDGGRTLPRGVDGALQVTTGWADVLGSEVRRLVGCLCGMIGTEKR